jgi:hypothetical protein
MVAGVDHIWKLAETLGLPDFFTSTIDSQMGLIVSS